MKGFTLIETLVAITVMTLAIMAPFGAVQQVIRATSLSRDQVVAASLAQEAIEYVRFVRYNNWLEDSSAGYAMRKLDGSGGPDCRSPRRCTVDAKVAPYSGSTLSGVSACASNGTNCAPLRITTLGVYTQEISDSSVATPYTRSFTLTDTNPNDGYVTVTVTITWTNRGPQTFTLSEDLYDWL